MKKTFAVITIVGAGLFAGGACAQPPSSSTQQAIQAVMDGMQRAAAAHDTDRFMAGYAREPSLVFVIDGRVIHGWEALRAQQLQWWKNGSSDVVYASTCRTGFVQLSPDSMATTQCLSSRRTGPDGKVSVGKFAVTSIWKKLPQGWRIIYGHESWTRPPG